MQKPNPSNSIFTKLTSLPARPYHLICPIAYMAIIYFLSSIPGTPITSDNTPAAVFQWLAPGVQNALHIPLYAGLSFLWCWALRIWDISQRALGTTALLITAAYGIFDEWNQSLVPGRYPSATDVLLNTVGAVVGLWLFSRWLKKFADEAYLREKS